MTLLCVSLLGVLTAAPTVELWQRETSQAPRSAVDSVLVVLRDALGARELPASGELGRCGPAEDCLLQKARAGGAIAIGLSIAAGRKGLLVDLEALAPDGDVLASATFPLPASGDRSLPEVRAFVEALAARWKVREPPAVRVEPAPVTTLTATEDVPESFWSRTPPRVTLIAAGVTVVGTVALGIAGAVVKGQLDTSLAAAPLTLTRPQALDQAGLANGLFTGSLISGLISGAVAVVLFILFAAGSDS